MTIESSRDQAPHPDAAELTAALTICRNAIGALRFDPTGWDEPTRDAIRIALGTVGRIVDPAVPVDRMDADRQALIVETAAMVGSAALAMLARSIANAPLRNRADAH